MHGQTLRQLLGDGYLSRVAQGTDQTPTLLRCTTGKPDITMNAAIVVIQ